MTLSIRARRRQSGYNLVEVLLAMAMLGVVAISIFTLFFMGRRNVYSGKQVSQAIAIGTQVLEDLAPLSRSQIYSGSFNIAGTATGGAFTIPAIVTGAQAYAYTNSNIRSTNAAFIASAPADITTENTPPGLLAKWTTVLGTKLTNGRVALVLTPDQDPTNTPAQYGTAQILRVRVFVRWLESGRQREVVLDTVKAF
ncbi:MAG TPA: prepilin-type N-terminal cleavage/methylation domain-containing protein [Thermoanaerobaculia bacterium]